MSKKCYIIFTFNVCNMGGAQLYVLRRSLHLLEKGFKVVIFTAFDNGIFPLKDSFKGIPVYNIPELSNSMSLLSKKYFETLLRDILNKIGPAEEYYLESHTLATIEWAELVSASLNGCHLAYPLAEPRFKKYHFNPGRRIILDKLSKNQFYGNNSKSLELIFQHSPQTNNYINVAFDETELVSECNPRLNIKKENGDYIITTVTRLDKLYVEPFIEEVKKFALKYPKQSFKLIIAGGSNTGTREKYLKEKYSVSEIPNLKIIFTGYIINLGKDIFNLTDVFVGMGTAAINAISQRCITVIVDPVSKHSSGFFGLETKNFAYPENNILYPISDKIEEAYLADDEKRNLIKDKGRELFESSFEIKSCFKQLDCVVGTLNKSKMTSSMQVGRLYRAFVRSVYHIWHILHRF